VVIGQQRGESASACRGASPACSPLPRYGRLSPSTARPLLAVAHSSLRRAALPKKDTNAKADNSKKLPIEERLLALKSPSGKKASKDYLKLDGKMACFQFNTP
jgi:hypothetical protein